MYSRRYSAADQLLMNFDAGLRTLFTGPRASRPSPAATVAESEPELTPDERALAGRLMRVNHCGEVCAQALYQGQAAGTKNRMLQESLQDAAAEENDHLAWCTQRLEELDTRKSVLNPVFYTGSFALGMAAGRLGDRWSLGFLAETERQVVNHLQGHLHRLPPRDDKSRAILQVMKAEEAGHASSAQDAGGATLPAPIRWLMKVSARIMTGSTYRL